MADDVLREQADLIDKAIREAVGKIMRGGRRGLPRIFWTLDLPSPMTSLWSRILREEAGFNGIADSGEDAGRWADALGLSPADPVNAGTVRYSGVVDGRAVQVWAVLDGEAFDAEQQAIGTAIKARLKDTAAIEARLKDSGRG